MTYLFNEPVINLDAFGRARVSVPFTLGDYKHLYGLDPNFIDNIENGGNITFVAYAAAARLTTNNHANARVVHQTKFYHHYMPGKSQIVLSSFNFHEATANVTKRTGYYDDENGVFLEQTGDGNLYFVLRSFVGGSVSERRVVQSDWNGDHCDGNGFSKFNLDISKTQLTNFDFQWLGVGSVRCGFVHENEFVYAHTFYNSNILANVYMSTPNLPVRCEIKNTGTTGGAFMDQICSTVMSEGGYVEAGQDWAVHTANLIALTANATKPLMAIRLKNTFRTYKNRMIVRMGAINVFSDGQNINWYLVKLPSVANLTANAQAWTDVNTNSGIEYNKDLTAFTDGEEIDGGFIAASTTGGSVNNKSGGAPAANQPSTAKKNYIVQNFDSSNSEVFCIVVKNLTSSSTNVGAAIQWREIY
jgi:hypothetical protein